MPSPRPPAASRGTAARLESDASERPPWGDASAFLRGLSQRTQAAAAAVGVDDIGVVTDCMQLDALADRLDELARASQVDRTSVTGTRDLGQVLHELGGVQLCDEGEGEPLDIDGAVAAADEKHDGFVWMWPTEAERLRDARHEHAPSPTPLFLASKGAKSPLSADEATAFASHVAPFVADGDDELDLYRNVWTAVGALHQLASESKGVLREQYTRELLDVVGTSHARIRQRIAQSGDAQSGDER